MRDFHFEQSYGDYLKLEQRSISNSNALLALLLFLYLIAWFMDIANGNFVVVVFVFLIIFLLLNSDNSKLRETPNNDEKWVISLVGSHFSWSSPSNQNERNFAVDISEIRKIRESLNDSDDNSPYAFVLVSGLEIKPKISSSINMEELIEILQERGISYEKVSRFGRYET